MKPYIKRKKYILPLENIEEKKEEEEEGKNANTSTTTR